MKIKEGMYVRIEPYYCAYDITFISKITSVRDKEIVIKDFYEGWRGLTNVAYKDEIKKASYDILDLIQEGDYVNGHKVIYVEDLDSLEYLFINADGESYYSSIYKDCNKPKTIVTKEQFKNMEYKIGE